MFGMAEFWEGAIAASFLETYIIIIFLLAFFWIKSLDMMDPEEYKKEWLTLADFYIRESCRYRGVSYRKGTGN